MIRFIDIRNQGTVYRFCFWDTMVDRFATSNNDHAWNNWDDFLENSQGVPKELIERLKSLCPEWVFNKEEDNLEDWIAGDGE